MAHQAPLLGVRQVPRAPQRTLRGPAAAAAQVTAPPRRDQASQPKSRCAASSAGRELTRWTVTVWLLHGCYVAVIQPLHGCYTHVLEGSSRGGLGCSGWVRAAPSFEGGGVASPRRIMTVAVHRSMAITSMRPHSSPHFGLPSLIRSGRVHQRRALSAIRAVAHHGRLP